MIEERSSFLSDTVKLRIIKTVKFVEHIENHLKVLFPDQDAKVMCKICNKTIDEIYEEVQQ